LCTAKVLQSHSSFQTEGSADYWLQQMREKGVRSQKLKVTETADSDNDEWLVDGEALKGKLKVKNCALEYAALCAT
jgi:hypothetical protein